MIETEDIFTTAGPTTRGRPFLNETQAGAISTSSTFLADKRTLMNWIKRTPEAIGILRQISMDVITRINFVALPQPKTGGRPKIDANKNSEEKATLFARNQFLKQQLRAMLVEGVALGNGYLWKGKLDEDVVKELIKENFQDYGIDLEYKELEAKALDENYVGEKTLQYVSSTSMDISLDKSGTKIKSYIQRVASGFGSSTFPTAAPASATGLIGTQHVGRTREWSPEQIIHYKFMELDGKVYGFTPMQSSFPIIKTLGAIKDYHGHYFEKGIMPDNIFNFEEDDPNSVHHQKMAQLLQEWWDNKRRGPAITTGKFEVFKINEWTADMEFRMLAIYYTGVIAFSVGMPLEKIRAILGGEIKSSTGGSDISNTDYQRNIYDIQDDIEQLMNSQFFNEEFGVNLKLERSAARDEVAEALRDSSKLNFIDRMFQLDWIKKDDRIDFLATEFPTVPRASWNPNPKPEMMQGPQIGTPSGSQKGQASQALSDQKREEQKPQQRNRPPTGIKELFQIDLDRMKDEVTREGITAESRNNLEMQDRGDNVIFYLTPVGIDKTYMTVVPKAQLGNVERYMFGPISKAGKRISS